MTYYGGTTRGTVGHSASKHLSGRWTKPGLSTGRRNSISLVYGLSYPKEYSTILRVILLLENILHHKNVPMIIQSLGSNGYLSLICSPTSTLHHNTLSFDNGIIYFKRVPCHRLESPPHDPAPPVCVYTSEERQEKARCLRQKPGEVMP